MGIKRPKITVVGAGFTGSTTSLLLAQRQLGDIVLLDIPEPGLARGRALDIRQSASLQGFSGSIEGTDDYADTAGSDLVIITAGVSRRPGMSRADLLTVNAGIVAEATRKAVSYSPDCLILVLTNPVDVMTYVSYRQGGLSKNRVFGQSGVLDTARFQSAVADSLGIAPRDVSALIIGSHDNNMLPLVRHATAGGVPLAELLAPKELAAIAERTRTGGARIVDLLATGSAHYAPGAALLKMAEAIVKDERRILPAVVYLEGEYGHSGLCLGVPVIMGRGGAERIISLRLDHSESQQLALAAEGVAQAMALLPAGLL